MQILAVDVGTGTQDILLFDTNLQPENCYKLVMPSPTMAVAWRIREATKTRRPVLLCGVTMGGGPSHWAARDHASAGIELFATPAAARTFDDDLDQVEGMGIRIISDDEAVALRRQRADLLNLELRDFDYGALVQVFEQFGLYPSLDGVAVAVFDHGAAPRSESDRQFRFDYLDSRIREVNELSGFAFDSRQIPPTMTRLQAVAYGASATGLPDAVPLMVMDSAPAAVLGALQDPQASSDGASVIVNVGNFHTLAFRLSENGIGGVFEHHTGLLNSSKLDQLIADLAASTLRHEDVFDDHGHGALVYDKRPIRLPRLTVTGPRRTMLRESAHPLYFAAPHGDMMITGCFGLVRAWADIYAESRDVVLEVLGGAERGAPWDAA